MSRKLGILCIGLGILLLLAAVVLVCYNTWESRNAEKASNDVLSQMHSITEEIAATKTADDPYVDHVDQFDELAAEMTVREINGYDYIGYLSIPVLGLELPVMSQWDYPRLRLAPCRQYGSAKTDDLVIAAHNYASHFGNLSKLRAGDFVAFTDMDAVEILYAVEVVDVLEPHAVSAVRDSDFDLVLYTCTYGGQSRVAVFCNRV